MFLHHVTSHFISPIRHQSNKRRMYAKSVKRNRSIFNNLIGAGVPLIFAAQMVRLHRLLNLSER